MKLIYIVLGFGYTSICLLFAFAAGKEGAVNQRIPFKGRSYGAGKSLKDDYDNRHSGVPKSPVELSMDVMTKLYQMQIEMKGGISTMEIMYKLDDLRGEHRLQTVLMFEKMDKDSDGMISADEFVGMYGAASSAPFRAFRALFKLFDYDNNGFISIWEILRKEATLLGFDYDLRELGQRAEQKFRDMDANGDMKVTEDEFVVYLVYLATNSIGNIKMSPDQ